MQAIAREFTANTVDDRGSTWPLRPLVRPVYRYESKADGAVFAMVQGTDPEAFLLLRIRGEGNDAHWEYAVTRFTDLEIHVRLGGREVYSGPHTIGAVERDLSRPWRDQQDERLSGGFPMSTAATILALALLAQPPAPADDPAARAAGHARSK